MMQRFFSIVAILLSLAMIAGCAAQGPSIVPNGVIRSMDISGRGEQAQYRVYTAYGADANGINTASTIVIRETPSMPGTPATSTMTYGQTAAQTGINKALVEQIIPAVATIAQGTVPGALIAKSYTDSAKTLGAAQKKAASTIANGGVEAAKNNGLKAAQLATDPNNPANLPGNVTFNNSNGQTQGQAQSQNPVLVNSQNQGQTQGQAQTQGQQQGQGQVTNVSQ